MYVNGSCWKRQGKNCLVNEGSTPEIFIVVINECKYTTEIEIYAGINYVCILIEQIFTAIISIKFYVVISFFTLRYFFTYS